VECVIQHLLRGVDLSPSVPLQDFVDWDYWISDGVDLQAFNKTHSRLLQACTPHAKGRSFCRTDTGHLGWVPADAEEGDCVCILFGGRTFYVLRPDGDEHYRLIGECYLHGLMQGEGVDKLEVDTRQFNIR